MAKKGSVPNFLVCPISLEVMNDPVTLSTGQTYDRKSIETWFRAGHSTCPSTMQVLSSMEVAPNLTLRALAHQWCTVNNYDHQGEAGPQVLPSTSPSSALAELCHVMQMVRDVSARGADSYSTLKTLRSLARDSEHGIHNRDVLATAGAVPVLAKVAVSPDCLGRDSRACEEALGALTLLPLQDLRKLFPIGSRQLTAASWVLNRGTLDGRVSAAVFLGALAAGGDADMKAAVGCTSGVFEGLLQLLKESLYGPAVEASLKTVLAIVSGGPQSTAVRAVRAGMLVALTELLPEAETKARVRTVMKLLEVLCSCAEGAEAAAAHALVVPVLTRVVIDGAEAGRAAAERALFCLWAACERSPSRCLHDAAGQANELLPQLWRLVHSECRGIDPATKQRAAQLHRQIRQQWQSCHAWP